MGKAIRCIGIILLCVVVVSCDVFFSTRNARENPFDPENELSGVYPEIDGYAEDTFWDEKNESLIAQYYAPMSAIVLRFDVTALPANFDNIYLRLYKSKPAFPGSIIKIHPIKTDWTPPIEYSVIQQAGFFDVDVSVLHTLQEEAGFEIISLEPIVDRTTDSIRYGIVIFSDYERVEFQAVETADSSKRPRLYVFSN